MGVVGSLRSVSAVRLVLQIPVGLCDTEGVFRQLERSTHRHIARRVAQHLGFTHTAFVSAGALDTEAVARLCGLAAATWAGQGFPHPLRNATAIDHCTTTLVEWLLPAGQRAARESPIVWQLLGALSAVYGLHHLCRTHDRQRHARGIIRAFALGVQHAMLHRRFGRAWAASVADLS